LQLTHLQEKIKSQKHFGMNQTLNTM